MATKRVQSTAFGAMTMKALESFTPSGVRLFDDPLAPRLLEGGSAFIVRNRFARAVFRWILDRMAPGLFGGMVCRTKAIDDALRAALANGVQQVAILGAGFDTRAYRIEQLRGVRVWELDVEDVLDTKRRAITRTLGPVPELVRYVPIDFAKQSLADVLTSAGFEIGSPAVLIWEGVSQYLPREAVDAILSFAGGMAIGSTLVFTYVPVEVFSGGEHARTVGRLQWQTGLDPRELHAILRGHGLSLADDAGADEYQTRYLRPLERSLRVFRLERVAVGVRR